MNSDTEHVWRRVDARYGKAWISATHLKLRPGVVVEVIGLSEGGMVAMITTTWGLEKRMFSHQLDFGREFRTRSGEWIPESDPRAVRWLLRVREELLVGVAPRHVGEYGRLLALPDVERVLGRNGWRAGK